MRYRGAALLAVCFTAAVSTQPVGLEVHHHAGAALPHVHPELAEATPFHHHDHDHPDRWSEPDGDGGCALRAARGPWTWHAHATSPFHRTAPARRARLPRPEPVALLAGADRGRQLVAAPVGCRSRAPPIPS
jgi:hypothetical protein